MGGKNAKVFFQLENDKCITAFRILLRCKAEKAQSNGQGRGIWSREIAVSLNCN